ncbi:Peptidyl-prolyl cis-trans isomerase, cyclophilin-type protein [Ceratobasidium theobromae]|uniref:peptidylprolyl isomerase n=1 Tax=Ceratobasidium theobromae TaxID=1582974 RepID=A0A5N5QWD3_9AGAM|nr:Peptidyl-prolyl cis-trans isomerase, cyclophilin-type protein [Ceratobasidium theobromae]
MADDAQDNAEAAARKRARISDTDPGRGDDTPGDASDDDDDDIGPMPVPEGTGGDGAVRKKRKVLPHERLFLDHLPSADRYSKSFMHRDVLNYVIMTKTGFLVTTSIDGHLKFWKKQEQGIEFVKHYRAHLAPIIAATASTDGTVVASVADDGSVKVFDVINFADMINMIKLDYTPKTACWVHRRGQAQALLAISDENSSTIRIYDGRGDGTPLQTIPSLHRAPVHLMTYTDHFDTVVSADESGFLEYWQPREPYEPPKDVPGMWEFKSTTDLYEFKKTKSIPTCLIFSPNSSHFVTLSSSTDRQVRIFNTLTGKMTRRYDESLNAIQEMQQAGTASHKLDDMEFGRRLAVEREIEKDPRVLSTISAVWDESGTMVLYPTLVGIKVVNTVTNRVVRLLGKDETGRWLNLALYQGAPAKKGITTMAMAASANPILANKEERDPTLFCTAYKRPRFYMFTREEPEDNKLSGDRDIFNERPTREEQTIASAQPVKASLALGTTSVIHTTMGDIHCRLFPEHAPKAVENFIGHAKSGYFEGVIFHRVIKKFMIQTGDPLGDGTGGTSIWGREFEDEFSTAVKHDRPYTLSMANAGPNTNGSQFFITTVVTPWLDNKHTVFGRVVHGLEVVHAIENVKVNKGDKPYEDIKIINVDVE